MNELPKEVWALRNSVGLVPPMDDDGTDGFMAWPTREQAELGLRHQMMYFEGEAIPEVVRIA